MIVAAFYQCERTISKRRGRPTFFDRCKGGDEYGRSVSGNGPYVLEQPSLRSPVRITARDSVVVVFDPQQRPNGLGREYKRGRASYWASTELKSCSSPKLASLPRPFLRRAKHGQNPAAGLVPRIRTAWGGCILAAKLRIVAHYFPH